MGSGEGRRVGPGGGRGVGRRGLSIELWTPGLDAGVGPGAGERVGRPKRRPGQLGGRTVGWAAGRPNGRVKEWKGWQGRTEKDGNGKGPGPPGSRPVKGPVRPSLGPPEFLPERVAPRQVPTRPSLGLSRVRSVPPSVSQRAVPSRSRPVEGSFGHPPPVSKGPFRQGPGPSGARPVKGPVRPSLGPPEFLPERVAPRQVPTRPSLGLSRVRSVPPSVSQRAVPSRSRPVEGSFGPSPGQPKGCSIKVPAHPGLGPSKVRSARASARRSSSPGGSPHPSTSGSPPHLFPFPPPSCPPPLLYRSGASYPSDAPPLHPAFRCG